MVRRLIPLAAVLLLASFSAAAAADLGPLHYRHRHVVYVPVPPPCYWCIRDGIYANTRLINHLEANPDVDEAYKGPVILAARADIRRLHNLLGPVVTYYPDPCCYARPRIYVR